VGARGVVGSGRQDAEIRDRAEQVQRIRPRADRSCVLSPVKEDLKRRPGVVLEVLAQAAEGGVTSAIIGPRTMEHLDDLLAGADVALSDDVLEQLDAIVPRERMSAGSTWPTTRRPS
jgi:aryl-alcohol dehydrogenase-like predicted oxidoreductase